MISEKLHQIKENETFSATRSEGEGKNIAFANKYFYIRTWRINRVLYNER